MRCLVVGDLHYALPQFDWVLEHASDFDVVIIAGDFLDISSMVDFRAQTLVAQKYIARLAEKTRLIVCSGNHDLDSRDENGEKIARWLRNVRSFVVGTDGGSAIIEDTLFTVCPWWDGPVTRAAVQAQIAEDAKKRTSRWIWVHHAPPDKSPVSWGGSRSYGDEALRGWIAEFSPTIVFSGHVHQSPFVKDGSWADRIGDTWVFNTGHQYGAPPTWLVYDSGEPAAYWFSAAGNQKVQLDQPLSRPLERLTALPDWLITSLDRVRGPTPAPRPHPADA